MYDIIILGSGPAGLTAALYAARGGKKTLVLGGDQLGGQMATIHSLENYPGTPGVNGLALANTMKEQAETFGAEFVFASAKTIGHKTYGIGHIYNVLADDGKEYESKSVIIATGAKPRRLDTKGIREFTGRGVSYCATCDGFFYTDKDVIVVGGGNSALNDALYLADHARSVRILYRKGAFSRGEAILVDRVLANEKISVMFDTEITEVGGPSPQSGAEASGVEYVITNKGEKIECAGVFIAIGHEANTDYLSESVLRDEQGRLAPKNLPDGMYVAGDVQSELKMQVATAVGAGCDAAMDCIIYINSMK
ncbi:MAG: FAD-dependent oxidoreductase [Alphaproteobacteria bacterium]|nr:FAD-dependent oxidoreductase [Alphaproteobacteria bacterium]